MTTLIWQMIPCKAKERNFLNSLYSLIFGPRESQDVKQLKMNLAILMQNQNLQQS